MTVQSSARHECRFVRNALPWVVGAAALAGYVATLNRWVSLDSLALVARVNGWDWLPRLSQPLLLLLTFPFRWLPAIWVPLALNLFTAVCASLTLALLARSVALLPHDRLRQQRLLVHDKHGLLSLPGAWVPVVAATTALGLQLTFWEHSIAASGEMLDVLLFAYVIRCLLEHRIHEQQSWLDRAALVFGVAMANNWVMIGLLPLFVFALLWTKRLRFLSLRFLRRSGWSKRERPGPALAADLRFLGRMALLGLAGFGVFLVLPFVEALSPDRLLDLGQALYAAAAACKAILHSFGSTWLRDHRDIALQLAAASLFPVLLLSIRWRAMTGRESNARSDLISFILYVCHAFMLLVCFWTVFDPPFSPRQIGPHVGLALSLYYLTALSIGYYSGFFLLLFGAEARERFGARQTVRRAACWTVPKLVYALVSLMLIGLLVKNLPAIRATRAPHLDQYARLVAASLPPGGAVILSDDWVRLALLQATLAREGRQNRYVCVDTHVLPFANYRVRLRREYPGRWPEPDAEAKLAAAGQATSTTSAPLDFAGLVQLVSRLAQSNRVCCLQPGPGFLLEQVRLQPHGLVQEMKSYPPDSFNGPPLTSAELAENQAFWHRAIETGVNPLLRLVAQPELPRPEFQQRLLALGHLQTPPPAQARILARWYSGAVNGWGVALQRADRWNEARSCFALALELNPENLPAGVNLQYNSNRLARQPMTGLPPAFFESQIGKYRDWSQIIAENGPFDEPDYCYQLGFSFAGTGMSRQAGQHFERVKTLTPVDSGTRRMLDLRLGQLFNRRLMPDQALQIAADIRADSDQWPLSFTNKVQLAFLEASSWFLKTNHSKAEGIIYSLLNAHPGDAVLLDQARASFTAHHSYSNALRIVGRQLQLAPDNLDALVNQGSLYVLMDDFTNAIPPLTRALSLTNTYAAWLNRAYAYVRIGRLDESEEDYRNLLRTFPTAYGAFNGLGEIAWQRKDTNAAIRYYQRFLAKAVPGSEAAAFADARLRALQPSRH